MTANSAACVFSVTSPAPTNQAEPVVALTAALARGEERAFREFHAAYSGRLLRYALTVTRGDNGLSEEAVQHALVKIASKVRAFTDEDAFWGWLARVVRSCIIDCARRQTRYAALLQRLRTEPSAHPAPEGIERAFGWQLQAAMAALDAGDRELLTAKYEGGRSTAELACEAGCTSKAMESRLARLRQRVRDLVLTNLRHDD